MTPIVNAFDIPGVPEIARYADAQRLARLALANGDVAGARHHCEEAKRFARLARVRLASRRERGAR